MPTYTDGETFAWVIDGRISLESDFGVPIVAWAEFMNRRSTTERPLLATFRAYIHGPMFEIWRLSEPDAQGHRSASVMPREMVTRHIPYSSWPHHADREGASALLCKLWDEALALHQASVEADRTAREADPLIAIVDALGEAATDHAAEVEACDAPGVARAAEYIRERIAGIDPEDLTEVLFRVTIQYGSACLSAADED